MITGLLYLLDRWLALYLALAAAGATVVVLAGATVTYWACRAAVTLVRLLRTGRDT